ncbi:DUF6611 family protein [uncultured Microbacterium sp.]|uniref:DUF6611 family protein n=1 Tax=uncultured Microbacterium sp. TaxID=191216 RepID=UPI0025F2EE98|nr:DUF6611 family protein [uncultured Microbacterium sp.]
MKKRTSARTAAQGGAMVIDHRPRLAPAPSHAAIRPAPPRWGYVSRAVSRYGAVSTTLVVYPPDASERDRRRADLSRAYAPVAGAVALFGWIGLSAAGAPPLAAIVAILVVVLSVGAALSRRARPVRRASAVVAACCSAFHEDDEQRAAQRRLDALADAMVVASASFRAGEVDGDEFARTWRAVHAHALGAVSARPAPPSSPGACRAAAARCIRWAARRPRR